MSAEFRLRFQVGMCILPIPTHTSAHISRHARPIRGIHPKIQNGKRAGGQESRVNQFKSDSESVTTCDCLSWTVAYR